MELQSRIDNVLRRFKAPVLIYFNDRVITKLDLRESIYEDIDMVDNEIVEYNGINPSIAVLEYCNADFFMLKYSDACYNFIVEKDAVVEGLKAIYYGESQVKSQVKDEEESEEEYEFFENRPRIP